MNRSQLFWHLVRFHLQVTPWFMLPLFVLLLLVISFFAGMGNHIDDAISMGSYRNFDQIFPFIYIFIMAAQMTFGLQWGKNAVQNQSWATGSYAFLFTRAIHRPTLYWAKLFVFCGICALPVFPTLLQAVMRPDIRIQLYQDKAKRAEKMALYEKAFPDLTVDVPEKNPKDQIVTLPGAAWNEFSLKAAKVLLISLLTLWCTLLARRWPKTWLVVLALFSIALLAPLLLLMAKIEEKWWWSLFGDDEKMLFWSHSHQPAIWLALGLLAVFVIWDSRRRFLDMPRNKTAMA